MEISNIDIKEWIELSLRKRNNTQLKILNDNKYGLTIHLKDIYKRPLMWFEVARFKCIEPFIEYVYFVSDGKNNIVEAEQRTIQDIKTIRNDIIQKIKEVNSIFIEELGIKEFEQQIINKMPYTLYHATFRSRIQTIKSQGLTLGNKKTYSISRDNVIYLTPNPYMAETFCKNADNISKSEYNSNIIVFAIDIIELDRRLIGLDRDIKEYDSDKAIYTYYDKINANKLKVVKSDTNIRTVGKLINIKRVPSFHNI